MGRKHVRDYGLFQTLKYILLVFILCPVLVFFIKSGKVNRNFENFNQQINGILPTVSEVAEQTNLEVPDSTESIPSSTNPISTESVQTTPTTQISDSESTEPTTDPSKALDLTIKYNLSKSDEHNFNNLGAPVLFYVYNSSVYQWLESCKLDPNNQLEKHKKFKHGDDVLFAEQIKNHPYRTFDPTEAKIFVIPIIFGYLYRYQNCRPPEDYEIYNITTMRFSERYRKDNNAIASQLWHWQKAVAQSLLKEPYFLANSGHDHLIVSSDYHIREPMALQSDL